MSLRVAFVVVFAGAVVACANAGGASPPVDSSTGIDAPKLTDAQHSDAASFDAPLIDAPIMVDAPIDGPPGSGLFCSDHSDCTLQGECCYSFQGVGICAEGTIILGACLPI
ncbi:MAG: hypothetical protein SFX73_06875 [Kofleriaceae bacterium]|nr:hypothetical protein [Kofleriaceae bacterium]